MQQGIVDFINSKRICVLALEMLDGSPHAATIHFAFDDKNLTFLFETYRAYRKCEPLFGKNVTRASMVVGFDENDMRTLQLDGDARLITKEEEQNYDALYFGKFPNKQDKSTDPKFVKFSFVPTWWRYTDWTGKDGKVIITSEDK